MKGCVLFVNASLKRDEQFTKLQKITFLLLIFITADVSM